MRQPQQQSRGWARAGRPSRAACGHQGCVRRRTHTGFLDGVAVVQGCEWHVRRWFKYGSAYPLPEGMST